jgi:NAD(P)-dependent dehydrogenase (short-subunit alcohol dehydrogenase family)
MTREALPRLKQSGRGRVINILASTGHQRPGQQRLPRLDPHRADALQRTSRAKELRVAAETAVGRVGITGTTMLVDGGLVRSVL